MDMLIRAPTKEKPKIPDKLIEATFETIKAGIRLDEVEREAILKHEASKQTVEVKGRHGHQHKRKDGIKKKQEKFLQKVERKTSYDDALPPERPYRALEDRRMGILVIGEQHRFAGSGEDGGSEEIFFLREPPLDYSFCMLDSINEILGENETPQASRNYKKPKFREGRYQTSSLRLSYNLFANLEGLSNMLYKMLTGGPLGLVWLDISCNCITTLDTDMLSQVPNITLLYLHGNAIADMLEVQKLEVLPKLKQLTLHGNPIEHEDGYRVCVLSYFPKLNKLDFFGVTRGDRANTKFAALYEPHWEKRHVELEVKARALKASQEMSLTERMLAEAEEDGEDDDGGELF